MDLESPGGVGNRAGSGAFSVSKAADVEVLAVGYHAIQKTETRRSTQTFKNLDVPDHISGPKISTNPFLVDDSLLKTPVKSSHEHSDSMILGP